MGVVRCRVRRGTMVGDIPEGRGCFDKFGVSPGSYCGRSAGKFRVDG